MLGDKNMIMEIVCDGNLNNILYILKTILDIIMIIAPILAIVSLAMHIFEGTIDPDNKKNLTKIKNTIKVLMIIFFIPLLLNLVTLIIGEKTSLTSCWNNATKGSIKIKYYDKKEKSSDKTKVYTDTKSYHGKATSPNTIVINNNISVSSDCRTNNDRTRTRFHSDIITVDNKFSIDAKQNYESDSSYTTQAASYDGQYLIIGQHRKRKINGVTHRNEGGRVAWFDINTGRNIANVHVGVEGIHMDRLAYDSDRDIVLVGSNGSEKMLQIDNKTKQIKAGQKYTSMSGDNSRFFKYDPCHHLLVGLTKNIISYYQYNSTNNTYVKIGGIKLESTSKWDPQNFNIDGQVIYIANSNPGWNHSDYAVIVYDMKTGKLVEYHQMDKNASGEHVEDTIVDVNGNLWIINVTRYWRSNNYIGNAYPMPSFNNIENNE